MTRALPIACLAAAAVLAGCRGQSWLGALAAAEPAEAAPAVAGTDANAGAVKAFDLPATDAVLLITGDTDGMLEACDCPAVPSGGLARRSGLASGYRSAFGRGRVMLLDAGDFLWVEPSHPRNRFVLEGLGLLGYDALALGDQEWAIPSSAVPAVFGDGDLRPALVSTNVQYLDAAEDQAPETVHAVRRQMGPARLAVVSYLPADAMYFVPAGRRKNLRVTDANAVAAVIDRLKGEGDVVVLVYQGRPSRLEALAASGADLIVHADGNKKARPLKRIGDTPVVTTAGSAYVVAVGLDLASGGIEAIDLRNERVDQRWPADQRLVKLNRRALEAIKEAREAGDEDFAF